MFYSVHMTSMGTIMLMLARTLVSGLPAFKAMKNVKLIVIAIVGSLYKVQGPKKTYCG